MNQLKQLLESVPLPFRSEVAREQRTLAKIEKQRQEREARLRIITQARQKRCAIQAGETDDSALSAKVDAIASRPVDNLYELFIGGQMSAPQLAQALTDREIMVKHGPEIKKRAHKMFVESAELSSKFFEKENAAALKGVDLSKPDDVVFVPAPPGNDGAILPNLPSPGVLAMLNLRPGEVLPGQPWEKINPNPGVIRDLDED